MDNLRLEDREVTYNVEMNGEFSCSESLQLDARQMGKSRDLAMVDTGSSHYMFNDKNLFVEGSLVDNSDPSAFLQLAGGNATLPIKGFGQFIQVNSQGKRMIFNNVSYVP
ncbi:hypothetical protein CROQUDRAFT_102015 [Cronartium quercuum f. sp. fusiforme G11]|uniref:Retrovirus-related Pol polyprotein from transposon TNT 1-94-like beta-barrel domain-containing protein n=1 Tax=Cronartium quercuum f. sp. fusiforme G11 TaxID=708437 RepID=A0A9P6T693_9BASI|nr:hypothetical protein CROQUDRAFT_102015 [Cronartium quercuum f. sp. fusiforme G11]